MPTVADVEAMLIRRTRGFLLRCGLDATTANGTNADLRDPIRSAALAVGVVPAGLAVEDDEVADVAGFDLDKLIDVAELRTLEACRGNWAEFDQSKGATSQSLSQLWKAIDDRMAELAARIARPYGETDETGGIPGPSAAAIIHAGRCIPGMTTRYGAPHPYELPYGGGCCW